MNVEIELKNSQLCSSCPLCNLIANERPIGCRLQYWIIPKWVDYNNKTDEILELGPGNPNGFSLAVKRPQKCIEQHGL